jgi:transcriptional regulator with XRE-family HTH domain
MPKRANTDQNAAPPRSPRERLRTWLDARGLKQADVCAQTGEGKMRVSRYLNGDGPLSTPASYEAIEKMTAGAVTAAELSAEAPASARRGAVLQPAEEPEAPPEQVAEAVEELADLAGEIPEDERDPLAALAKRHAGTIAGGMLKLAVSAKSEAVRLRALDSLADRGWGKPTQHVVDDTPRPPAEDSELLAVFDRLRAQMAPAVPVPAAAVEVPRAKP